MASVETRGQTGNNTNRGSNADEKQQEKRKSKSCGVQRSTEPGRRFKIYRAPPTPPLEVLTSREKSFVLDCRAVSHISYDYSRANPKLGSVIPPYNSVEDKAARTFFTTPAVKDALEKTGFAENPESIAGKSHDQFYVKGPGFRYLAKRNQYGNGHHPEEYEGHRRYMGDNSRVMIGYSNMYGYRRNIPKLRHEPPSSFGFDPRWYERISKSYKRSYTEEELMEHYKHTYVIGYPFHDNNYNNFHARVKYVIIVKVGSNSPAEYEGNLGINIVSRTADIGFIKLDKNILKKRIDNKEDEEEKSDRDRSSSPKDDDKKEKDGKEKKNQQPKRTIGFHREVDDKDKKKKNKNDKEEEEKKLFSRGQLEVFEFEDRDIRTINGIILSKDVDGDEVLFIDYIDIEVHKQGESQVYRFPFESWLRTAKQDKKSEETKAKFGRKNCMLVYTNEKPKFEYSLRVSPGLAASTAGLADYKITIDYEVKENIPEVYIVEFISRTDQLPKSGKIILRLNGTSGDSEAFNITERTETLNKDHNLIFKLKNKDIGDIKSVSILYEDMSRNYQEEFPILAFLITDPDHRDYYFKIDKLMKPNREKVIKAGKAPAPGEEDHEPKTYHHKAVQYDEQKRKNEKNEENDGKESPNKESHDEHDNQNKGSNKEKQAAAKSYNKSFHQEAHRKAIDAHKKEHKAKSKDSKKEEGNQSEKRAENLLSIRMEGHTGEYTKAFKLEKPNENNNKRKGSSSTANGDSNNDEKKSNIKVFKKTEALISTIRSSIIKFQGEKDKFCKIRSVKITSDKGHHYIFKKTIVLFNGDEIVANDKSKEKPVLKKNQKPSGQIMVQLIGEKKKTELFPLKNPESKEDKNEKQEEEANGDENIDVFSITDTDLGKIKNVLVKFDDKKENENVIQLDFIEVVDPKGDEYKFVMDMRLKSGEEVLLPRKQRGNSRDETATAQQSKKE